jgi:hypothetical protein
MVAAWADEALVIRLRSVATRSGLVCRRVIPAISIWAAEAVRHGRRSSINDESISLIHHESIYSFHICNGRAADLRHAIRREQPTVDSASGSSPAPSPTSLSCDDPAILAATRASKCKTGQLMTAEDLEQSRKRALRRRLTMAGVSLMLLLAAAALDIVDKRGDLRWLEAERARIAVAAAAARTELDDVLRAQNSLQVLDSLERNAPRATATMADLTNALPDDAFASLLFISPDSSLLEGYGADATGAFHGLRRAVKWEPQGFSGEIQQQVDPTGASRDHFFIVLRPARTEGGKP